MAEMNDNVNEMNENMLEQFSTALKFAQIMEKNKEGVPLNEIVITTQGGKSKALSQKEKATSDNLRRQQVIEKLKKRTFRGENSLAEDITKRIHQCQMLVKHIFSATAMSEKDVLALQRNLESTHNRASSLVKEVEILEGAIDRKKKEDPVISEYEANSAELFQAIKNKDYPKITELRTYCEQNSAAYNLRQKRLKPYLIKARQVRLKFVAEKRRIMRIQFETYNQAVEVYAAEIDKGKFQAFGNDFYKKVAENIQTVRQIRYDAKPIFDRLNQPLGNVALSFITDIENELDATDQTYLNQMGENVENIINSIDEAVQLLHKQAEEKEKTVRESIKHSSTEKREQR